MEMELYIPAKRVLDIYRPQRLLADITLHWWPTNVMLWLLSTVRQI